MINESEILHLLQSSFDDHKLDNEEKHALIEVIQQLDDEQISYLRNRAFELLRSAINQQPADALRGLKWLENIIKTIDMTRHVVAVQSSVHFSPGDDCRLMIENLLKHARRHIDICVFTISDNRISDEILAAHRRGVRVRVISDNDKANDRGSDIDLLHQQGVAVMLDESPYHMHHKFALFDRQRLVNGSFNWTRSASESNAENILVTNDAQLLKAYQAYFDKIWKAGTGHAIG